MTNPPSAPPTAPAPTVSPAALDAAEPLIYAYFLRDAEGAIKIIREDTFTDTYPQTNGEARQFIASNVPGVSHETLENYLSVNSTPSQLPSDMNLGVNFLLITTPEFLEITNSTDWRNTWRQRFPDSEVSCTAFSRIGFDSSHTQALLYVTRLWIEGGYYLMEYDAQQSVWEMAAHFSNVIIN